MTDARRRPNSWRAKRSRPRPSDQDHRRSGWPASPDALFRPRMEMMAKAAAPMPIAAGEQELGVTVHVVYELKPGK